MDVNVIYWDGMRGTFKDCEDAHLIQGESVMRIVMKDDTVHLVSLVGTKCITSKGEDEQNG